MYNILTNQNKNDSMLLKTTSRKHIFSQNDELFQKYFFFHVPNELEKNKVEELKKLLKDFYNKAYETKGDLKEFIPYAYSIGYLEKYGYYTMVDGDRGIYEVTSLGKNLNPAFKFIMTELLTTDSTYYETENRQTLKKEFSSRFGDIEYFHCLYFAEYCMEKLNKYYEGNIPEEIVRYYEEYLNNNSWSEENNIAWIYDPNKVKFNCHIIKKKLKTRER